MNKIVLDSIEVHNDTVRYKFYTNKTLDAFFQSKELFIQYGEDVSDIPNSILAIPFVNVFSGLSWLSNSMLFVDELDKTYYEAHKQIKVAYEELHNTRFGGVLVPSRITINVFRNPSDSAILLFGGGVDCHSSFLRNHSVVSEVVNIYGWLSSFSEVNSVDLSDKQTTSDFAARMGVKASHIRSNFASLFNLNRIDKELCFPLIKTSYWYGLLHSMAFLSISAPLAWKRQVPQLMIASSFTKGRSDVHCGSFMTTDSEFKFCEQGFTSHDSFDLSRQEKVRLIVEYQKRNNSPYPFQACSFNDHNCCSCEKCFRTIVELVAENANPRDFGFKDINGPLKDHWLKIINSDIALWGVTKESFYYSQAKNRMRENYLLFDGENKDFVDWFLAFDFEGAKRAGLKKYYRKNFFSILKRKLHLA